MRLTFNCRYQGVRGRTRFPRALAPFTAALLSAGFVALSAHADDLPRDLMRKQFPAAEVTRKSLYLTQAQKADLERKLGRPVDSRLISLYLAAESGRTRGIGLFDTHTVRTKSETLFVIFSLEGAVETVEVVAFHEPAEYRAPERWLALFAGRRPGADLEKDLPALSGATLTVRAVKGSTRRAFHLYELFRASGAL